MRLRLEADVEVVGEASNGVAAIELARELSPDVVVMDVRMPVMDGITATRRILEESLHLPIIALSLYDDTATIQGALAAGATAFIAKSRMDSTLVDTIRSCVAPRTGLAALDPRNFPA